MRTDLADCSLICMAAIHPLISHSGITEHLPWGPGTLWALQTALLHLSPAQVPLAFGSRKPTKRDFTGPDSSKLIIWREGLGGISSEEPLSCFPRRMAGILCPSEDRPPVGGYRLTLPFLLHLGHMEMTNSFQH